MAKTQDPKSVTKRETTEIEITKSLGAFDGVTGFEDADSQSFATPFLRILQPNSPQLMDDSESYIEGSKPGFFFNNVTNEVYGKEIVVIPFKFERLFVEWKPDRGGFVALHDVEDGERLSNPTSRFGERIGKNNENSFQETHTFYFLISEREEEGPIIFPLSLTGIKHSRKWMSMAKMLRLPDGGPAALFSSEYTMTTLLNENEQGRWYQIGNKAALGVTRKNWISEDQLEAVRQAIKMFSREKLRESFEKSADF